VWRILLVGTDGSLLRSLDVYLLFAVLFPHSEHWYCNNLFLKKPVVWNGLSIVTRFHYWILDVNVDGFEFSR
jgi:hypothetical protein